jgi:hypothetical protein
LQRDPLKQTGGAKATLYAYGGDSPTTALDPTGLAPTAAETEAKALFQGYRERLVWKLLQNTDRYRIR